MKAVILAGGLGTRLRPLTLAIPKPLLPIGEKTILEIQIANLARHGFDEIFIATNYKADYVESFVGDGSKYGVKVIFSKEKEPLGTCGPVRLLAPHLTDPFVVMNGDILTSIHFGKFYEFGLSRKGDLAVATKKIRTPFNFGSVETAGDRITKVEEKPDLLIEILAGVYFMRPSIFQRIPENKYFGMDHLILSMLKSHDPIHRYLMDEFWLDIGRIDDYHSAQALYKSHFDTLEASPPPND